MRPLSCQEVVELVTDYLEGALPRRDRKRFEKHLAGCGGCTAYLEQMRRTIEVAGRIAAEDLPVAVRADLLAAFRGWRSEG